HGTHSPWLCPSSPSEQRLPGSVRRIGHRARARSWRLGAFRKLLRSPLDAHHALLFGLSRCGSALLAILRRKPESFSVRALLRRVSNRARGLHVVIESAAEKSSERKWLMRSASSRI